jgi:hypothetical protein
VKSRDTSENPEIGSDREFRSCALVGRNPFAKENEDFVRQYFRHDFPDYVYLDVPGGTDLVGTISQVDPKKPFGEWRLVGEPDTWFASTVGTEEQAALLKQIIDVKPLGDITTQQKIASDVKISLTLPDIKNIISADTSADISSAKSVSITASNISQQDVNFGNLCAAKANGKLNSNVSSYLDGQNFEIVQSALMYGGYTLIVDASNNTTIAGDLKAAADAAKVVGQGAGLSLKVSYQSADHIEITDTNPVVFAYLPSTPSTSSSALCSTSTDFALRVGPPAFRHVKMNSRDKDALTKVLRTKLGKEESELKGH